MAETQYSAQVACAECDWKQQYVGDYLSVQALMTIALQEHRRDEHPGDNDGREAA